MFRGFMSYHSFAIPLCPASDARLTAMIRQLLVAALDDEDRCRELALAARRSLDDAEMVRLGMAMNEVLAEALG